MISSDAGEPGSVVAGKVAHQLLNAIELDFAGGIASDGDVTLVGGAARDRRGIGSGMDGQVTAALLLSCTTVRLLSMYIGKPCPKTMSGGIPKTVLVKARAGRMNRVKAIALEKFDNRFINCDVISFCQPLMIPQSSEKDSGTREQRR